MIRTRFAPSPTGFLHVGGLRTALYNYLFSLKNKGQCILRIEDTDQNRLVPQAKEGLIRALEWAGINFDEGPHQGGNFGPYEQSKRLDIYQTHIQKLLEEGNAYYCFCTKEILEAMKAKQMAQKLSPRYDGRCRRLDPKELQKRLNQGEEYCVRMKIKHSRDLYRFEDLIRGEVAIRASEIDDQVLMKSDQFPTYHFANVVDDHLMQITHVIRGEEWLSSVPKHIQLYEYFGWEPPQFAHLPLLLNEDRTKLSKRQNDVSVEDYQKKGYLKEALVNFVALLGWNPKDNREILDFHEMLESFSLEGINKAGAIFDLKKLAWVNQQHMKKLSLPDLLQHALPFFPKGLQDLPTQKKELLLQAVRSSLSFFSELEEKLSLFEKPLASISAEILAKIDQKNTLNLAEALEKELTALPEVNAEIFRALPAKLAEKLNLKPKEVFFPIRVLLTKTDHGPEMPLVAEYYGKKELLSLLKSSKDQLLNPSTL